MVSQFFGRSATQVVWTLFLLVLALPRTAMAEEENGSRNAGPDQGQYEQAPEPSGAGAPAETSQTGDARISKGRGTLPNEHGQMWREYDISPYTSNVLTSDKPQQAIIDWILRETGTEIWFSEPLGILSATHDTLRVYHTPEVHDLVREVYYRFVNTQAEAQVLSLKLVTIQSPNWRTLAHPLLRPVTVQSPGVEAWLLSKENAAVLKAQLSRRNDYREHNAPNLVFHNGQSHTLSSRRPKNYVRAVGGHGGIPLGNQVELAQLLEGYDLHLSMLMSLNRREVDAVIKAEIDQVEKLVPLHLEIPYGAGQTQRVQVQVPQLVSWRLHERFRWPANEVLVLSCGVVAAPSQDRPNMVSLNLRLDELLSTGAPRVDALLFIEHKGTADQAVLTTPAGVSAAASLPNRGRY